MEFKCHGVEPSKVNICNEGQGACGLAAGGRRSGWSREEAVCMGEEAGRGLAGGNSALAGCRGPLHAQAVVAMGGHYAGRVDPAINSLRMMGTGFLVVSYL